MQTIILNGKFLTHRITGVERYAREIIAQLDKLIGNEKVILAIPKNAFNLPHLENIKIKIIGNCKGNIWEQIDLPRYVKKEKGILINLCNTAPLIRPDIVCMHDMKIKAHPEFFSKKFIVWYRILFFNQAHRAKKILTISEFSKSEIIKYYHVNGNRIYIIPCGWQHFERVNYDQNALDKYSLKKNEYYFSMCSLEPNKNFKWVAEKAKTHSDKLFVVAGSINKKIFSKGLGFECPKNMKLIGYVTDEEAKTLMSNAQAFLFPTIYEGFGIPPLEAMSVGTKNILVTDSLVMHEIFENQVQYIDFKNSDSNDMHLELNSQQNYKNILYKYSWEKSSKYLLDVVKS